MRQTIFVFIVLLCTAIFLVSSTSFASFSAEISRDATVNVTADTQSIIQLSPNPSYEIIQLNQNEELEISPQYVGADSINANMHLQIGSTTQPSTDYAFTIKSLASRPTIINLTLIQSTQYSSTPDSVQYIIENESGAITTISANQTTETFVLSPTETLYVSIEIDTIGEQTGNLNTILQIQARTQ